MKPIDKDIKGNLFGFNLNSKCSELSRANHLPDSLTRLYTCMRTHCFAVAAPAGDNNLTQAIRTQTLDIDDI